MKSKIPRWTNLNACIVTLMVAFLLLMPGDSSGQEPNCTQFTTVGSPVQLTFNSADDVEPSWSPDGTMITFSRNRTEIRVLDLAAGTDAPVTSNGNNNWHPDWSPDGQLISYTGGPNSDQIWVSAPDGSGETAITTSGPHRHPDWSPDGSEFAYTAIIGVEGPVRRINSDGSGTPSTVVSSGWYADWSPDGSRIAFARYAGGGQIYLVDPDGSNLKNISTSSDYHAYPAWSPDGSTIACSITKSGNSEIYIIDTLGNELLQVTNSPSSDGYPTWAPLGDAIAFHSNRSGNADIWKVGIACEGANILVYITWDPSCSYPCCCYPMTFFDEGLAQVLGLDGHSVTLTDRVTTPVITSGLLANYDQFWFLSTAETHDVVLSPSETDAIFQFRNQGGGLFVAADNAPHYTWTANQIALPLGVQFYGSVDHAPEFTCLSPAFDNHPLFAGVSELLLGRNEGAMSVTSPADVIATYNGNNVTAILDDGLGRCVFDVSFVRIFDSQIMTCDNAQYFRNIADWLQEGIDEDWLRELLCLDLNADAECAIALASAVPCVGSVPGAIDVQRAFCRAAEYEPNSFMATLANFQGILGLTLIAADVYTLCTDDLFGFPELLSLLNGAITCIIARIEENLQFCEDGLSLSCILALLELDWWNQGIFGIFTSPVEISVEDTNGNQIGVQVGDGIWIGTGSTEFLAAATSGHKKYILTRSLGTDVQLKITGNSTAVYPDSTFDLYVVGANTTPQGVAFENIPIGFGMSFRYRLSSDDSLSDILLGDIDSDGIVDTIRQYSNLAGVVHHSGAGLSGIPVCLVDSNGTMVAEAVTNSAGEYDFGILDNGRYTVSIVTPLGYLTQSESVETRLFGLRHFVDFNLTPLDISPQQRSRGYWAHQVNVHLSGIGHAQESLPDMSNYMSLIRDHFNNNLANPITIFEVPQPATQTDSLEALRELLTVNVDGTMNDRAKQQLTALMLNVVSLKLHQTTAISEDGATVSQAITHCNELITDADESNDEIAKDIADDVNNGIQVSAGVIPLATPNIAYKGAQDEVVQTPNLPKEFSLEQNYPNPFNPDCEIKYTLPRGTEVTLSIYNVLGQKVKTLVDEHQPAGERFVKWDGTDDNGNKMASGIYFYRMQAGNFADAKKMVIMK